MSTPSVSKELFFKLATGAGYCCAYSLLKGNWTTRPKLFAERLGVDKSTVTKWRGAVTAQVVKPCRKCPQDHKPLPPAYAASGSAFVARRLARQVSEIPRKLSKIP